MCVCVCVFGGERTKKGRGVKIHARGLLNPSSMTKADVLCISYGVLLHIVFIEYVVSELYFL